MCDGHSCPSPLILFLFLVFFLVEEWPFQGRVKRFEVNRASAPGSAGAYFPRVFTGEMRIFSPIFTGKRKAFSAPAQETP